MINSSSGRMLALWCAYGKVKVCCLFMVIMLVSSVRRRAMQHLTVFCALRGDVCDRQSPNIQPQPATATACCALATRYPDYIKIILVLGKEH